MEIYKLNKQFIWNLTLRNKYIMQKGQYNNENGRNTAINGLYEILSCRHTSGRVWSSGPYFRIMAKPCLDLGSIIGEEFIEHWSLLSWFHQLERFSLCINGEFWRKCLFWRLELCSLKFWDQVVCERFSLSVWNWSIFDNKILSKMEYFSDIFIFSQF